MKNDTNTTAVPSLFARIAEARRVHGSTLSAFESMMERRERQRIEGQCPLRASAAHRGLGPSRTSGSGR